MLSKSLFAPALLQNPLRSMFPPNKQIGPPNSVSHELDGTIDLLQVFQTFGILSSRNSKWTLRRAAFTIVRIRCSQKGQACVCTTRLLRMSVPVSRFYQASDPLNDVLLARVEPIANLLYNDLQGCASPALPVDWPGKPWLHHQYQRVTFVTSSIWSLILTFSLRSPCRGVLAQPHLCVLQRVP